MRLGHGCSSHYPFSAGRPMRDAGDGETGLTRLLATPTLAHVAASPFRAGYAASHAPASALRLRLRLRLLVCTCVSACAQSAPVSESAPALCAIAYARRDRIRVPARAPPACSCVCARTHGPRRRSGSGSESWTESGCRRQGRGTAGRSRCVTPPGARGGALSVCGGAPFVEETRWRNCALAPRPARRRPARPWAVARTRITPFCPLGQRLSGLLRVCVCLPLFRCPPAHSSARLPFRPAARSPLRLSRRPALSRFIQ